MSSGVERQHNPARARAREKTEALLYGRTFLSRCSPRAHAARDRIGDRVMVVNTEAYAKCTLRQKLPQSATLQRCTRVRGRLASLKVLSSRVIKPNRTYDNKLTERLMRR